MAENTKTSLLNTINNCLEQQLSEYELLKSMYPEPGEIVLTDKNRICEIKKFLSHNTEYIPNHLDFKLNLLVDKIKLEIFVNLPSYYPKEEPDIYVRCNELNRLNESRLNSNLADYIKENYVEEVCLYTVICWLQENIHSFIVPEQNDSIANCEEPPKENNKFARFWIYSHHIYNKKKREEIVKKAKELELTGFSLPGKPGIICIEGSHCDCIEWWKYVKAMAWKKIVIKKTELFELPQDKSYKKFTNFQELNINSKALGKFMQTLGFTDIFNELFGLCNY